MFNLFSPVNRLEMPFKMEIPSNVLKHLHNVGQAQSAVLCHRVMLMHLTCHPAIKIQLKSNNGQRMFQRKT